MNDKTHVMVPRDSLQKALSHVNPSGRDAADDLERILLVPIAPEDRVWCQHSMKLGADEEGVLFLRWEINCIPIDAEDLHQMRQAADEWIPYLKWRESQQ